MKDRQNQLLLAGGILSAALCVTAWNMDIILAVHVVALPFFCVQLLLCRVSAQRRRWLRAIPAVPIVLWLLLAGFYFLRDSGCDRLAALVFALMAIAPGAGCLLGWAAWGIPILRRRRRKERQG